MLRTSSHLMLNQSNQLLEVSLSILCQQLVHINIVTTPNRPCTAKLPSAHRTLSELSRSQCPSHPARTAWYPSSYPICAVEVHLPFLHRRAHLSNKYPLIALLDGCSLLLVLLSLHHGLVVALLTLFFVSLHLFVVGKDLSHILSKCRR